MRFLISGVAGFIGTHLSKRLLSEGHSIVGIDNHITSSQHNLKEHFDNLDFKYVYRDISKPFYPKDEKFDFVIHLACPASPVDYLKHPLETIRACSLGTYNCLGIAHAHKAKFLLASTSEVYGDPTVHPQPEWYNGNVNPIGVRAVYDESKRFAETMTMSYLRVHNVDIRIARIFNTYGPVMRPNDGRVVSNFICQALKGEDITVYGDGLQTRSLCYIDDMVEALRKMIDTHYNLPINIGNPDEHTVLEIAELIKKMTKSKSKIAFQRIPEDDPKRRKPAINHANELLDWSPKVSLKDGLKETIKYFKKIV